MALTNQDHLFSQHWVETSLAQSKMEESHLTALSEGVKKKQKLLRLKKKRILMQTGHQTSPSRQVTEFPCLCMQNLANKPPILSPTPKERLLRRAHSERAWKTSANDSLNCSPRNTIQPRVQVLPSAWGPCPFSCMLRRGGRAGAMPRPERQN